MAQVTVYAIAQLTIHDRARYQRYAATFLPILTKYGGQLLAADERPEVAGGSGTVTRLSLWPSQTVTRS